MQKTSVYLSDDEVSRLSRLAVREGLSQAEVIRRAIRSYKPERRGNRDFLLAGVGEGPGGSIVDIDERELLDGFGD